MLALARQPDGRFSFGPSGAPCAAEIGGWTATDELQEEADDPISESSLDLFRNPRRPSYLARAHFPSDALVPPRLVTQQLREKLLECGGSFSVLDKQVEEDSRRRREILQRRLQQVMEVLGDFEQRLVDESSERETSFLQMHQAVERQLDEAVRNLQQRLSDRFALLSQSIESLCERCANLERGIRQFRGELPTQLQVETNLLKQKLSDLTHTLHEESKKEAEKDAQFHHTMEKAAYELDAQMQKELLQLARRGEALQELIDEFASPDEGDERKGRKAQILGAIAELQAANRHEVSLREQADDVVVQAINEYTATLQRSLRTANT